MIASVVIITTSLMIQQAQAAVYYANKCTWSYTIEEKKNEYDDEFNIDEKQLSIFVYFGGDAQFANSNVYMVAYEGDSMDDVVGPAWNELHGEPYEHGKNASCYWFTTEDDDWISFTYELDDEWFEAGNWFIFAFLVNGSEDEYASPSPYNPWGKISEFSVLFYVNPLGAVIEYGNQSSGIDVEWINDLGHWVSDFLFDYGSYFFSAVFGTLGVGPFVKKQLAKRKQNA